MVEQFIELLKEINIAQIFVIFGASWFFYNKIDKKFEKLESEINNLKIDMTEVKTILRMKGCCALNDNREIKKAE